MSARDLVQTTNLSFLVAGVYFLAIALLREGSVYSIAASFLCFIAFGLGFRRDAYFSEPWRVATAVFVLILFASQVIADTFVISLSNYYVIASIILNGGLFVIFLGVVLASSKNLMERTKGEEEPEEKAENEGAREGGKAEQLVPAKAFWFDGVLKRLRAQTQ